MAYMNQYGWQQPGAYAGYTPPEQITQMRQGYAQQMQQQQTGNGLIWVQGEAGARGYMVAPGQSVLLMDSERQTMYLKSADGSGMSTMRIYDYTERAAQTAQQSAAQSYATREEVEALRKEIAAMKQGKGGASDEQSAV